MAAGIRTRHGRRCRSRSGGRCNCSPSYEAWVYSKRDEKKIRRTFTDLAEAKGWRSDAEGALRRRTLRAPAKTTLAEAGDTWVKEARKGAIRNRSGDVYKPSAIRGYEAALRLRVKPDIGHARLSDVRRTDLQAFVERLVAFGHDPSTIQVTLMPLRAIYRRAIAQGLVEVNPTTGLELPAVRSKRDRIASPEEAAALIAALPRQDRGLWATAMYAGLRRGELMALRWADVDLGAGLVRVERSWDAKEGFIEPKSAVGRRTVPIAAVLRRYLVEHRLASVHTEGLVFGKTAGEPFSPTAVRERSKGAWKQAEMTPITLHESRHTFASLMIAAGVNAKALSTYMGHANISITLDRYGHLMPGNEVEAAGMLDRYLGTTEERAASVRS
jgi:integrase